MAENSNFIDRGGSLALLREHKQEQEFLNVPNTPVSKLTASAFIAGKEQLGELPERMELTRTDSELTISRNGTARTLTHTSKDGDLVQIELSDIELLSGDNKTTSKLFALCLVKLNEQAVRQGKLTNNTIEFSLQELIDLGFCTSIRGARNSVNKAMEIFTKLSVKGSVSKGKKTIEQKEIAVLFPYFRIKKNVVTVDLNPRINWEFLTQFYTILPKWAFKLRVKSWDLLYYIFYLARQSLKRISEKGYFTLSFKAIHAYLMLPEAGLTKNPQRDIKDVIESAITEIEDIAQTSDLQFIPRYNENDNIKEYLSNGYLEVHFKGVYSEKLLELYKRNTKRIKQAEDKRERIIEAAKIKNMQKKLKKEEPKQQEESSLPPLPAVPASLK